MQRPLLVGVLRPYPVDSTGQLSHLMLCANMARAHRRKTEPLSGTMKAATSERLAILS
ncbi:hypothetical protein [Streptomyces sp. NPDC048650]|uniref:hypothetical protein n=1 Tax=Streptomyces sp. NPDC048650 TaxID=3365583 RepID=UPI003712A25D